MNVREAIGQLKSAVRSYTARGEDGMPLIPRAAQRPVYLVGPPGVGKTAIAGQVAAELGVGLVSYTMTHHTRQSALGLPRIVERSLGGETRVCTEYTMSEIIAGVYRQMEESGVHAGILFLDEINCVSETLTALSFCWWALRNSGGMVTSSYRSAREQSGYKARASRMACAVCSILAFCASVGLGQGKLL